MKKLKLIIRNLLKGKEILLLESDIIKQQKELIIELQSHIKTYKEVVRLSNSIMDKQDKIIALYKRKK